MNLIFGSPLTDDLHQEGLVVAIHNDYKLSNINHTFWLMIKDNIAYKGEGKTNIEALDQIREQYQKRSKMENTLTLISNEVERARRKFPGAADLTVALMEECGELAQATLKCDQENIIKEAIQVAAVAIRIIEEGDSTFKNRKEISLDEKYEYEKELNKYEIKLNDCRFNNILNYIFDVTLKFGDRYLIKSKKKPTKEELRKYILGGGQIDDNWNCEGITH